MARTHWEKADGWTQYRLSKQMRVFLMTITPAIAAEMLVANTNNRNIRQWKLKQYRTAMERSDWTQQHPATVAFDWNGVIIDGQHRLQGCVDSGKTLYTIVVFGCDPDALMTVDGGIVRTLPDRYTLAKRFPGWSHAQIMRGQQTMVRMLRGRSSNKNLQEPHYLAELMDHYHEGLSFVEEIFGALGAKSLVTSPVRAVWGNAYYHANELDLRRAGKVYVTGESENARETAMVKARNHVQDVRDVLKKVGKVANSNVSGDLYVYVAEYLDRYVRNRGARIRDFQPGKSKKEWVDPFPLPPCGLLDGTDRVSGDIGRAAA